MAHPYKGHKAKHVEKRRVKVLMRSGGHADAAADKKLFSQLIDKYEARHHGEGSSKRLDKFAKGGRTKHKPHVHISINHLSRDTPPVPGGAAGVGPAFPPGLAAPPGAPPGGVLLPPSPPMGANPLMRKSGGRLGNVDDPSYRSGISTPENLKKWAEYSRRNSYARGGKVPMKGGADTGVGRLDKAKAYRARG